MLEAGRLGPARHAGSPPLIRVNGSLTPLDGEPMENEALQRMLYAVLTQKQRERFEADLELDLATSCRATPGSG
jgi:twitching motility protein PilT